jgi:hypothetical protein
MAGIISEKFNQHRALLFGKDGQDAGTKGPCILVCKMWVKLLCLSKVFVSRGYGLIG